MANLNFNSVLRRASGMGFYMEPITDGEGNIIDGEYNLFSDSEEEDDFQEVIFSGTPADVDHFLDGASWMFEHLQIEPGLNYQ